jgi:hypothetical protein
VPTLNTDRLIDLLSSNLEPIRRGGFERSLVLRLVIAAAGAFGLMWMTIGPRANLGAHVEWITLKLLFALGVIGSATPILIRSARPGRSRVMYYVLVLLPFVAVGAASAVALSSSPATWRQMLLGATTISPARCVLCIMGFAAIPLLALIHVLRDGAPTQPSVCGAAAGLAAGGVGAAAYALACASDSIPFIAVWYDAAIGAYAILGALAGPWLLRW